MEPLVQAGGEGDEALDLLKDKMAELRSVRQQLKGAVEALREVAALTVADPIHREYPSIQRLQKIAANALDRLGGQYEAAPPKKQNDQEADNG